MGGDVAGGCRKEPLVCAAPSERRTMAVVRSFIRTVSCVRGGGVGVGSLLPRCRYRSVGWGVWY
jgi:hypothetical protein